MVFIYQDLLKVITILTDNIENDSFKRLLLLQWNPKIKIKTFLTFLQRKAFQNFSYWAMKKEIY